MKVTNCTWEMLNIDLRVFELEIPKASERIEGDLADALKAVEHDADLLVLKMPNGEPTMYQEALEHGFFFVELQFELSISLNQWTPPNARLVAECSKADAKGLAKARAALSNGIFENDRISLAPQVSADRAARRMLFWMDDELGGGADLLICRSGEREHGFFLFRELEGRPYVAFSSTFEKEGPGGVFLQYSLLQFLKSRGYGSFKATVSSNNLGALRLNLSSGLNIDSSRAVFHKFCGFRSDG